MDVSQFFKQAENELIRALTLHGDINSLHEGYAVLLEEVDELWDIVRQKAELRDPNAIRIECVQIAAMAAKVANFAS